MFSVPGWNLSAPLATQVEQPKPRDPSKEGKKAKKRKQKQEEQVNEENLGELWSQLAEGKDRKNSNQVSAAVNGEKEIGAEPQDKKSKKRKRKGNKASNEDADGQKENKTVNVERPDFWNSAQASAAEMPMLREDESKRDKKKRKKEHTSNATEESDAEKVLNSNTAPQPTDITSLIPEPKGLTPLQKSMRNKLTGARFRHLNESLYTKPSKESLDLFKDDPSMFEDYHRGFAQQVESWPENPVDGYVSTILVRGKAGRGGKEAFNENQKRNKKYNKRGKAPPPGADANFTPLASSTGDDSSIKPLKRDHNGTCHIADLGCGTASLSYRLQPHLRPLALELHSFDLSKPSGPSADLVTVADMSALPLQNSSVEVAIFCLALMGTNWLDFVDEAYRILRWKGELWVAEIKSRFARTSGGGSGGGGKGKGPANSVGSLRKGGGDSGGKKKGQKNKKSSSSGGNSNKPEEEGPQNSSDEAELAQRVDGEVAAQDTTDVSAFVDALRKRGFVLDAPPERPNEAIDLGNKMFVKMQFVKAAQPVKGKNVDTSSARAESGGGSSLKMGLKGKKYAAIAAQDGDGMQDDEAEAKALKPCLYKIR